MSNKLELVIDKKKIQFHARPELAKILNMKVRATKAKP